MLSISPVIETCGVGAGACACAPPTATPKTPTTTTARLSALFTGASSLLADSLPAVFALTASDERSAPHGRR
jgi:hypothetical protein